MFTQLGGEDLPKGEEMKAGRSDRLNHGISNADVGIVQHIYHLFVSLISAMLSFSLILVSMGSEVYCSRVAALCGKKRAFI